MNDSNCVETSTIAAPEFSEGQKLAGCYCLKRRITGAADGEVWLANDEVLGKDVSLHFVPKAVVGDADAMRALRQEVKRNRQLIHPSILRVYDLVEDAGWAAVSMDAFGGESLAVRLATRSGAGFDPAEIQPWLATLCQTLEDAHKISLIHRDVSAENIFLTSEGKLLVANFGIGRCIEDAVARITGKASPGFAGSSPQTVSGGAGTRSDDVYSVGALMFHLLTGRPVFSGDDVRAEILNTPARAVSDLRPQGSAPIPQSWEKTIAACLDKHAEGRPHSALEIAKSISAERFDAPVAAKLPEQVPAPQLVPKVELVEAPPERIKPAPVAPVPAVEKSTIVTPSTPSKLVEKNAAAEVFPDLYSERSRFPAMGFAVAIGFIVVGLVGFYLNDAGKHAQNDTAAAVMAPAEPPEGQELRSVNNKGELPVTQAATDPVAANPTAPDPVKAATPTPVATPAPMVVAQAAPVKPTPAVTGTPDVPLSPEEAAVAEKTAALEKAKQAVAAAEKVRQDMMKQQQQAEAAVAEAQKAIDAKSKALGPVKKAAEDLVAQRKKLEDEQKAADIAAEQARQLAAEKARAAEAAKKAIADLESRNKDKFAASEKADSELQSLQKALASRQHAVADAVKAAADADAARQQQLAAIKKGEDEIEQARLAAAEAKKMREAAEAERRKLDQELAEMQDMVKKKMAEIEARRKELESGASKPSPAPVAPKPVEPRPVEKPATPVPAVAPAASNTPAPTTPAPMVATPAPAPVAVKATPVPATPAPAELVMKTEPATPAPVKPPASGAGENSLGMKFAPVGDVEFSIWQTRVKDFESFAKSVNLKSTAWRGPGFKQGPDHPVVNVTWIEAIAFCKWLTDTEHRDGSLPASQYYRLPTDLEWSKAVGLGEESGKTPEARDMGVPDVYPWGTQWPPPAGAGNYTGEETGSDVAIKGYDDGFAWTSPVGSFAANKFGLYDMGGNVWQWCMDTWNTDSKAKVLRGASWYNGALKLSLLSSCRVHASPDSSTDNYGFRIVRASDSSRASRR
jgi:formylglycine-generating enzyme required for sulfatase activity/serine/threonine protein kinase